MKTTIILVVCLLLLFACNKDEEVSIQDQDNITTSNGVTPAKSFLRRNGASLVIGDNDTPLILQGVNFSYDRVAFSDPNAAWAPADHTDVGTPVTDWNQKKHYQLAKDLGFNVVRLNLSYRVFEDNATAGQYKASAWILLDQVVAWSKEIGIYLILDLHVAPGGAGIASCMGCGWRTWDDPSYQTRTANLWQAIATRYKNETQIVAYDLLNEPVPSTSAIQWESLATNLTQAIRAVDTNHLLIQEMPVWIFDKDNNSTLSSFDEALLSQFQFLSRDNKVIYDFHFYLPLAYTLQDETGVDGGIYPDVNKLETTFAGVTMPRDKTYLQTEIAKVISYWQAQNVPINFGEWGTADSAMTNNNKGGLTYITDMLDLMKVEGINWQFYFMNKLYDIQCCYTDNPTTPLNADLLTLFQNHLAQN